MKIATMLGALAVAAVVGSPLAAQQDTTHGKMVSAVAKTNAGKQGAAKSKAPKKQKEDLKALAKISKDSAKAVALSKVPAGSKVRSTELEREKGTIVYSFDIKVPKQSGVEEILVSAIDGSVVSQEHESPKKEKAEKKAEAKKQ